MIRTASSTNSNLIGVIIGIVVAAIVVTIVVVITVCSWKNNSKGSYSDGG